MVIQGEPKRCCRQSPERESEISDSDGWKGWVEVQQRLGLSLFTGRAATFHRPEKGPAGFCQALPPGPRFTFFCFDHQSRVIWRALLEAISNQAESSVRPLTARSLRISGDSEGKGRFAPRLSDRLRAD